MILIRKKIIFFFYLLLAVISLIYLYGLLGLAEPVRFECDDDEIDSEKNEEIIEKYYLGFFLFHYLLNLVRHLMIENDFHSLY